VRLILGAIGRAFPREPHGGLQMRTRYAAMAGVAISLGLAAAAQAQVSANVPTAGASYFSATDGGAGTLQPGGRTAFMWTTGDFVGQTIADTGLATATEFSDTFTILNNMNGVDMVVDTIINGVTVGSWTAPDCGGCGVDQQISFDFTFAPVASDPGNFDIFFQLDLTAPPGEGSLAFLDGGHGTLVGTPITRGVPEPASWALLLMGFGGLGAMMRRRRSLAVA
jgi:hypothetical protein